jgi:hypothetical protein
MTAPSVRPLLAVTLDCANVTYLGVVGILSGLTSGAALPEQVPALVERILEVGELLLLLGGVQAACFHAGAQCVLPVDQCADSGQDPGVIHGALASVGADLLTATQPSDHAARLYGNGVHSSAVPAWLSRR